MGVRTKQWCIVELPRLIQSRILLILRHIISYTIKDKAPSDITRSFFLKPDVKICEWGERYLLRIQEMQCVFNKVKYWQMLVHSYSYPEHSLCILISIIITQTANRPLGVKTILWQPYRKERRRHLTSLAEHHPSRSPTPI